MTPQVSRECGEWGTVDSDAEEAWQGQSSSRVELVPLRELWLNPGRPVPTLTSMADQVESLWPLRSAIAGAITATERGRRRGRRRQNPQRRGQAIQEALQVELITDMLMVGTQHMRGGERFAYTTFMDKEVPREVIGSTS